MSTFGVDAYQLTTLVAHDDDGRTDQRVSMAFFFRKMPKNRGYVVFAGLRRILEHAAAMRLDEGDLEALDRHPLLGPALAARPALRERLASLHGFEGEIDAVPEGTLVYAGPALRTDGKPLVVAGAQLRIYVPLMQVRTDMVRAKLIETPWLGFINHMCMVASKAARVVDAAQGRPVLEFGARRTHPEAAVDASYAAYLAGTSATSNMLAYRRHGVPATGTMDHFAVQASERKGRSVLETEAAFFASFVRAFPQAATLLVDTYDTIRGVTNAVTSTERRLTGVRLDSSVTPELIARTRAALTEAGAPEAKIFVSDGLDEFRVRDLAQAGADGFGVGENITCSPDAATGIGAVAKLVVNGYGKITMKLARGSGKATLPGELQTYRFPDHDLVALASEAPPSKGTPLLSRVHPRQPMPSLEDTRAYVRKQIEALPPELRRLDAPGERRLVASDGLVDLIAKLTNEAGVP
jgi:nicotinate phosphoribosyltransferase